MTRRMIDGKIRKSQTFQKFTYRQRDLWQGLIEVADDQGRLPGNVPNVRSLVWPADDISLAEVESDLSALEAAGNICRYKVNDGEYIQLLNWHKYQAEAEWLGLSEYPAPKYWRDRARFHGKNRSIITLNWGDVQDNILYATTTDKDTNMKVTLPYALPNGLPYPLPFDDVNGEGDVKGEGDVNGDGEGDVLPPRPNIFSVYEHEIGMLTPIISDELILAEKDYPDGWVALALKESALNNKRSWSYAKAILKRCSAEGRPPGSKETVPKVDPFLAALEKAESNGN